MRHAGLDFSGRIATRFATWFVPSYLGRCSLARMNPKGYISPTATIHHDKIAIGRNVFIGDRVVIYNHGDGGAVELGDRVHLYGETYIQTGQGGNVKIGRDSHIQPCCQFSGYKAAIKIGNDVQIAPRCAFYPYDHGTSAGVLICQQPLTTKGDIRIEDDAWLGYGVIVLSGVRIGRGAVIGAGSVVTHDIPDGGIAAGAPARVLRLRGEENRGDGDKHLLCCD
jgi:acetyltransferase-like isoleucine patch superfamily enzyme